MKKSVWIIFLLLLLCGCGEKQTAQPVQTESAPSWVTEPVTTLVTVPEPEETVPETLPPLPELMDDAAMVQGSRFVSDPELAEKLDVIFAGDFGLCTDGGCHNPLNAALGTRAVPQDGDMRYWRYTGNNGLPSIASGGSCWAYANCAYGVLYDGAHPQATRSPDHQVIREPNERFCYESFRLWGVRDDVPVYVRTFNHSILVLSYDETEIIYVDGNGDRKGFIAIRREPWQSTTGGINFYGQDVALVVQPTYDYVPEQAADSMQLPE